MKKNNLFIVSILIIILGFLTFSFGYWIITLISANIFNFIIPFKWSYAFGAWSIMLIFKLFIIPAK